MQHVWFEKPTEYGLSYKMGSFCVLKRLRKKMDIVLLRLSKSKCLIIVSRYNYTIYFSDYAWTVTLTLTINVLVLRSSHIYMATGKTYLGETSPCEKFYLR